MFGCPSIGNVFRPAGGGGNTDPDNGNEIVEPPRNPPKSRTPLAFLRDRGAASIGALRGRKGSAMSTVSTDVRGSTSSTIRSNASSATTSAVVVTPPASSTPDPMTPVRTASGSQTVGRTSSDTASTPPTPPPTSPPRPISIPVTLPGPRPGVTSRPTRANARASPPFGIMAPRMPAVRVGPIDEDGYSDMILPCGLYQEEVIDIMYRDLSPEDFEALSKLDERLPKRNTAGRNLVDRLPRMPAGECGVTECGVCLAELASNAMVVKLPCGHAFHPNCISKWLTQCKNTCPFCTAPIQPSSSVSTCGPSSNTTRAV